MRPLYTCAASTRHGLHADEALDLLIPGQAQRVIHHGRPIFDLLRRNRLDGADRTDLGAQAGTTRVAVHAPVNGTSCGVPIAASPASSVVGFNPPVGHTRTALLAQDARAHECLFM